MSARILIRWFIWRLGVIDLSRRLLVAGGRFTLNFHGVSRARHTNIPKELQPHHSVDEFRQVLSWVNERFQFLTPQEFLETARPGVLLTFDDGHANNYLNVLPLLEEFKAPGVFFVSTQHILDPQDWLPASRRDARLGWGSETSVPQDIASDFFDGLSAGQLASLARSPWAVVGSHTVAHPSLTTCDQENLEFNLNQSRHDLQEFTGQVVDLFAYPNGEYNRHVAEAVRRAGYRAAFAVDPLPVGLPPFEIPRVGIYAADPPYLSLKLSGLYRRPLRGSALTQGRNL